MQKKHPSSRRTFLELTIAVLIATTTGSIAPVRAQGTGTVVAPDQLMAPQAEALPDIVQGKADAPVTMIEYASMTCSHCARFHAETYPTLLKNYVDTGKVKFILREFPLDPLATAAFMLARCSGDKRNPVVDLLFDHQKDWAFTDKPIEAMANLLKQTGMSQADFEKCINNQDLYNKVTSERDYASAKFGIDATPTFFVNGRKVSGELTPQQLGQLLDPLVKK
ncbi:MAG TPA: DsbA family protein [Methylovirgula sp.]|nr:DsbA family protein [Methylovirgula sp.]